MKSNNNLQDRFEKQKNILIKTKEKTNRNNNIIILTIVIVTLVSSMLSLIISYKSYRQTESSKENNPTTNEKYYQTLAVVFNDDSKIKIDNLISNFSLSSPKIITISNDGNSDMSYDLSLSGVNTNLLTNTNFIYEITKNGETSLPKEVPLTDSKILSDVNLSAGETITYLLNIKFNSTIDISNQATYYYADIVVEQNNKTDLLK